MAKPVRTDRLRTRNRNIRILRRRLKAEQATIATLSAIPKANRTATQKKNLAAAVEDAASMELLLDISGALELDDVTVDVDE